MNGTLGVEDNVEGPWEPCEGCKNGISTDIDAKNQEENS